MLPRRLLFGLSSPEGVHFSCGLAPVK